MRTFLRYVRRYPWVTNVTIFGSMYSGGDVICQLHSGNDGMDWTHIRNVAIIAFGYHGNASFFWNRFLERTFPGRAAGMLVRKLLLDQTMFAPMATTVFYTSLSFLEGQEDITEAWRKNFFNTYKTGLMFWPFVQLFNFSLMPVYLRTPINGAIWGIFLCFSQQKGDGTAAATAAAAALAWMSPPRDVDTDDKTNTKDKIHAKEKANVPKTVQHHLRETQMINTCTYIQKYPTALLVGENRKQDSWCSSAAQCVCCTNTAGVKG